MKWKSNKYIVLLLIGIICIVALLPGCFAREEIICSLGREELEKGIIVGEQGETFVGESFALPPGVYQVRVAAQNTQNAVVTVEMKQYGGEYRSLRANSASLSAGQTREQFEVYVAATIKEGYLQADFSGCTHETIQEIQLVKLNWGNRMALCMVLAIVVLLMGVLSFRDRILAGKIEVSKQVAFWALLGGVFTAYYPYLTTYMNLGEETIFHLLRIEGLAETLLSGQQFPVRVQTNWMCDHGYLVSGFCSDLFLLIPAAIRMTGFSLMTSYKLFVFIVTAVTAGLAYMSFEKCTRNVYAAMAGALVYLLMPYRIYLCYHKGALDELVAMAFLPLVLSGIYLVFQGDKRAWGYLVTGLTGVLHGDVFLFGILLLMTMVSMGLGVRRLLKGTFFKMAGVAGLILLVNAGFWVPMLVFWLKDNYHLHTLLEGGVRTEGATVMGLSQLFLHAGEVREGMAGLQINPVGIALMAAFLVFGGFILQRERKGSQERVVCIGLAIAILVSVVLALLDITEGIMAVTACLGGMFAAFLICYLQKEAKEIIYKGSLLTGILLTIMAAMYQVNDIAYEKAAVEVYTAENLVSTTALEREYLLQETYDAEVFYHEPVTSEGLLYENYQRNATTITMDVKNTTDGEAYLEVPLTGYWGYDVEGMLSDDKKEPYLTRERGAHGDLRLAVPAGYQGSIKIAYHGELIFRIAEGISICSVLGCVIYGITKRKERSGHGCKEQKAL